MKRIVYLASLMVLLPFIVYSQTNPFAFLSETGPAFKISGGMGASMLPGRKTVIVSGSYSSKPSEYNNYTNFVFSTELTLQGSLFNSPYLSHFFKFNGSLGWLGNAAQSGYYYGNEIKVGARKVKLVVEPGMVKLRRGSVYAESSGTSSQSETIGVSEYLNTFRLSIGANYVFQNNSEIEFRYVNEQYSFESRTAGGIYLSYLNKKAIMFYAECIFNHPVTGNNYLRLPVQSNLSKEGIYLRVGITRNFFRNVSYKNLVKRDQH